MFRTMKRMVGVAVLLTLVCAIALSLAHVGTAATPAGGPDFRDRVRAQEAIDRVYTSHRTWPKENPGPKPLFEEMISREDLEAKVNGTLLKSAALEKYWQVSITAEQLQAEMDRMARETKAAATLQELFASLGNDPALVAECLARPALADRLIHERYAGDTRFHGETRNEAEVLWGKLTPENFEALGGGRYHAVQIERVDGQQADVLPGADRGAMRLSNSAFSRVAADFPEEGKITEVVEQTDAFVISLTGYRDDNLLTGGVIVFPKRSFDAWWEETAPTLAPTPTLPAAPAYTLPSVKPSRSEAATAPRPVTDLPIRINSTELSTGAETLTWGGGIGVSTNLNTGLRYDTATDTRMALPAGFPCPSARWGHTAVWTGTEMIVWGGSLDASPCAPTNTGGRYNPLTGAWSATSTKAPCPAPSVSHTATWTGKVMAVQGGTATGVASSRTGGRYNPATDTWAAGSTEDSGPHPLVTATVGATGATYTTLQAAFTDINNGSGGLTGAIILNVVDNTTETASAVLNASGTGLASYTSVLIQPSGGAPRTISGAIPAGSPLIDLNGADNVTFDGLNTGGNSLTISNTTASATSGTSTIRFLGGATGNTVTNSTILGSFSATVATNGGNIYFATDALTANGNDNNTVSNCNIGPAGTNLPTKGIYGNGTATNAAIGNNGILIDNNNIYDTFGAAVASAGIYIAGGCSGWTITNNKFYQTAPRTWTTGSNNRAIDIQNSTATTGAQGFTITGNTIGYASNSGTGIYTLTGSTGKFAGIVFNGLTAGTASSISNNTIAAVSMTGVTSSGSSTSSPFMAILVTNGVANTNGNTIGSQTAAGSLTFSTNSTTATDVYGMYNFSVDNWTANGNLIGGISVTNAAASGTFVVYGMRANTSTSVGFNAASNLIGGTVANSVQLSATGVASQVIGMHSSNAACTFSLNAIRNLTTNIGTGTTTGASVIGINITTATPNHTVSQNTISGLTNSNAAAASVVTGIQFTGGTANVVQRNLIFGLTAATSSATAEVNGIRVGGGTTIYRNNMIAIGAGVANAIGAAATNAGTTGVNGINEFLGTDSFFHNSVYIGGAPTAGTGASYAFNGTQTVNTRSFRDNIFVNARNNSGATGKNYAVKINGTAANPTGLTINNNVYYASGAGGVFGFFNSLDVANLASWKTAVGQDAASFESNPQYLAPANAVPDLHINPLASTVIEGNGADVLVTDDFDGQVRASLTPVDIGADAGNFIGIDLSAPAITYTALGNTASTGNRTLTAAITDVTGVPTSGALQPRVYYKKGAGGTWFSSQGSLASGSGSSGTWDFTIVAADMGGVTTADVIYYYVIAQDLAATPNIGSNPSGVVATDVNTVTMPPATPNTYTIVASFSGPYNVGTAELYTSLTNAGGIFEAINAGVLAGNVTINITSDLSGELGTNALNQWSEDGVGGYTMLIRPSGAARVVTGTNATGLIKLNGADRVTIDGSLSGGTDRSLTFTNTNAASTATVMWIASASTSNGANNDTIKNCVIYGTGTTTVVGITAGSGTTLGSAAEAPNSGNTIQNNLIYRAQNGIYLSGCAAPLDQIWTITGNAIGSTSVAADKMAFRGMYIGNAGNFAVTKNTVNGVVSSTGSSSTMSGIQVGGSVSGGTIAQNSFSDIKQVNTTGWGSNGIFLGASSTASALDVYDNFVFDVASYGYNGVTATDNGYGIMINSGGGYRLYHNSVRMTTDQTAATGIPAAINIATGLAAGAVDLRDNIFANTQTVGTRYAIYCASANTVFSNINYNDYYPGTGTLGYLGSARATIGAWQTATGQDLASISADPLFVSTTDLHLQPCPSASPAVGAGTPIPSVTVDIDGQARSATAPDIGADEITKIAVTNPAVTTGTAGVLFSQTFTQSGGIAPVTFTTASALPSGLSLAANGTLSGTPTVNGTFPITVTATDANGCTGVGPVYNLVISCPTITLAPAALPGGTQGTAYNQTIAASPLGTTYTYSVTSGSLPPGLTLDTNTGALAGTPTGTGAYAFTITATGWGTCAGNRAYSLAIADATGCVTNALAQNFDGVAAPALPVGWSSQTIIPGTGVPPAWSTRAGGVNPTATPVPSSPNVLSFNSFDCDAGAQARVYTQSPMDFSAYGSAQVHFMIYQYWDGGIFSSTSEGLIVVASTDGLTWTAQSGLITNADPSLSAGAGHWVSQTVDLSTLRHQAAVYLGLLGVSQFGYNVHVDDISVTGSCCPTITVSNPAATTGTAGVPFSQTFTQSGGAAPVTFSTASALPAGLALAASGTLSGTPTVTGTFPITVTATDANGCVGTGAVYSLVISCPAITLAPATLPNGLVGAAYSQTITASGGTASYTFAVTAGALPGGLTLAAGGALTGIPTAAGLFNFTVTATDANGCTGFLAYSVRICPVITVAPATLPNGLVGTAYNQTITASGGIGPYTFAVTAGVLPGGLTLAAGGALTGTPTTAGLFNFTTTATDANGCTGSLAYSVRICPVITVAPATLPNGFVGTAYSQTITATGGTGPYTFAVTAGALPGGLTLAAGGALTGTPTSAGLFNFTITATDANGCTGSLAYSVRICPVITVAPATLPAGLVGTAYNQTITATGGTGPYTFAVTAGALPGGLTLAAGGALTGTPTAAGLFNFTITATDANGCTGSLVYSVRICPIITVAPATLPAGLVGTAYNQTITATGGTGPYTFAVTAGALPGGLTLAAGGALTGTPTTAGLFNVTVTATDANGCAGSLAYSVRICPAITLSPASLPGGLVGSLYSQTITASGGTGPYTFAVTAGALPGGLTLAAGGVLTGSPTANGTFTFTVTATDANGCTGSASYTIIVSAFDLTFYDDYSRSQVCVNSTTGAFAYTVLLGVGAGTYTGAGTVTTLNGQMTLATPAGLPYSLTVKYLERYHKATASYTNRPLRVLSQLTDNNTLNDPPVCAP